MNSQFDRFKFRQLTRFIAVAETGSISEAAAKLSIPQPALSRTIRNIEEALGGVKLLERSRKGVTLTLGGKKFLDFARLVYENFESTTATMISNDQEKGGTVRIGLGAYEGNPFLIDIIDRILKRRPNVQFQFISGRFEDLIGPLVQGRLDFIFGPANKLPLPPNVRSSVVAHSKPDIFVRSGHHLATQKKITLKTLASEEWIVPVDNTLPRKIFDNVFLKENLSPPVGPVEMSPSILMTGVLRQRNLVGLVHPQLNALTVDAEELVPLDVVENPFSWPIQLTTIERRHPYLAVNETINLIKTSVDGKFDA